MLPPQINKSNPISFPVDVNILAMFGILKPQTTMEITSFDGKPFLTPPQFGYLSYQQQYGLKEKNSENTPSEQKLVTKRVDELCKKGGRERRKRSKENMSEIDFQLQAFEKIQKKVKKEDKVLSPSTQEEDLSDRNTHSTPLQTPVNLPKEIKKKLRRIIRTDYNEKLQMLVYKIESLSANEKESFEFTREEILEEDPKILLYFYENHLEFSKTPQFKPEKLKKL